ncbi:cardiolipin synthase ClsB [Propionivibrio sp.]|uniref:cardiolipin synthase ClsB n=1 Tax=Propionivibrio sp. TaxID=2212460 RepID=UPI0026159B5E|nr:cardiolipin synthase ClsB [Propionivibrio sp.]
MPADFVPGNRLTLLNSGAEFFPALLIAISEARRDVHLESYIFEHDSTGRAVADALIAAARRGVAVRLLVDGFGTPAFADTLLPALTDAGVMAVVYRPDLAPFKLRRHRLRRLHRKLVIIDGEIAFVGGINIIDDLSPQGHLPPRFDYAVQISGPLLRTIQSTMRRLWEIVIWVKLKRRYRIANNPTPNPAPCGKQMAAFLVRDNIRHRRDIEEAYLVAIASARKDILIANAYFLPGRRFRRALGDAAQRGVRVTILLQGCIEYLLLHYATQALYGNLLNAGIHIFEYHHSFLHAKVAVIDEQWATVGSSNIDPFSLLLSKEANLIALDHEFAGQLRRSLETAMHEGARELLAEHWQQLPWYSRLLRWASYNLVRIAIGISGYGGKH